MPTEDQGELRRTILLVDDDATFRANLTDVLRVAGYNILEAEDGTGALKTLDTIGDRIDLMIVDLCLPENLSGLDVIVAAARRKLSTKIVAASGVFDDLYLEMAHDLGADVAIRKPLESEVAAWSLQTVRGLLGGPIPDAAPSQKVVVLADDEDCVRLFVKSILQRAGYQVLEAADGEAALTLIDKIGGALDLLVTDCQMPKLDGAGLARAVKAKYPNVPVVYMSGYTSGVAEQGLDDPARQCAFIPKPFFPKQFVQLVGQMVGESTKRSSGSAQDVSAQDK